MKAVEKVSVVELQGRRLERIPKALASIEIWGFITLTFLLPCFLALPWQQVIRAQGQVVAYSPTEREQKIQAPITGRVERWFVVEGTRVKAGDPIVELVDVDPNYVDRLSRQRIAEIERIEAALAQVKGLGEQAEAFARSRDLKVQAARLKVRMAEQNLISSMNQARAAKAELEAVTKNRERSLQLFERGLISERDLELTEVALAKAEAARNHAEAEVLEAMSRKNSLEAEVLQAQADGEAKVAKAEAERQKASAEVAYAQSDLAKVEVEVSRQESRIVRAVAAGTIVNIDGNVGGGIVRTGQHLAILIPETESRAVEVHVEGNDAPLLFPGRKVRLQFDGFPGIQFGGWPSVSVGTFGGVVNFVDPAAHDETGKVRVLVVPDEASEPWPAAGFLRQRVRVSAWLLLDRVRLGWELWRQVNGFPPSMKTPPQGQKPKDPASAPKSEGASDGK